jgi:hypothetical protein
MDINDVIGGRLGQVIRDPAKFRSDMSGYVGEEWAKQTYYDALHGDRIFRVSELVALARAAGVQAYSLLDAQAVGAKSITISRRHLKPSVSITTPELMDLFIAPGKATVGLKRARANIQLVLDNFIGQNAREADLPIGGLAHDLAVAIRLISQAIKE